MMIKINVNVDGTHRFYMKLTEQQTEIIKLPLNQKIWLEGMASAGKTTVGVNRVLHLLDSGVSADSILVYVPQRTLVEPYVTALRQRKKHKGGQVTIHTIGSLALKTVDLFWLLVSGEAGFKQPDELPNFLSLELVQYFMTRAVEPLVDEKDYFNSVRIDRARLYSQIVDNLNKSAIVGFPIEDIAERLKSALGGDTEQEFIYHDAQVCAIAFRKYCLEYNLLDFSLQVDLLIDHLWAKPEPRNYLTGKYKHLIVDNIEEDNPASHRLLSDWLDVCESAFIIYDTNAGFRRFLGADSDNAYELRKKCDVHETLNETFVMREEVESLGTHLAVRLGEKHDLSTYVNPRPSIITEAHRYHPQMVDWVTDQIASLVHDYGVNPNEIVVLAPYMSDALRFGLVEGLDAKDIKARSHRPSRALRDEPSARTLLTLARLAHLQWEMPPTDFDLAYALMMAIDGLDFIRAKLLVEIVYQKGVLYPFANIAEPAQNRITYEFGQRFDRLRDWLNEYIEDESAVPIDIFFRQIFGEILSQEGFGFHADFDASKTAMNLVDSARNFRWSLDFIRDYEEAIDLSNEYIQMVDRGLIANFYLRDWTVETEDSVLIAPAYTFLLNNRPVDYQFWLNIGSEGWSRRLYQPLTHPYVLSRQWQVGETWDDEDEQRANRDALSRLMVGLTRRCKQAIYLGYSELSESGYEQRGLLLDTIQGMLRRINQGENDV
jgi:hypothetical protein